MVVVVGPYAGGEAGVLFGSAKPALFKPRMAKAATLRAYILGES